MKKFYISLGEVKVWVSFHNLAFQWNFSFQRHEFHLYTWTGKIISSASKAELGIILVDECWPFALSCFTWNTIRNMILMCLKWQKRVWKTCWVSPRKHPVHYIPKLLLFGFNYFCKKDDKLFLLIGLVVSALPFCCSLFSLTVLGFEVRALCSTTWTKTPTLFGGV
jgi:hypothetical protein